MKNPFFKSIVKSILIASVAIAVSNCGEDSPSASNDINSELPSYNFSEPTRHYSDNGLDVFITEDGRVLDANGTSVGYADAATGTIMSLDGAPIVSGVDFGSLPLIPAATSTSAARVLSVGGQDYIINPPAEGVTDAEGHPLGVVLDATGAQTGVFVYLSGTTGYVATMDLIAVLENINLEEYPVYEATVAPASSASTPVATTPSDPTPSNPGQTTPVASSASAAPKSSNSVQQPKSSAQQQQQGSDGTCYDKFSGTNVKPNTEKRGPNNEAYAYSDNCEFQCWWSQDNNQCSALLGSGGNTQPKSSASQPKSSASQPKSSASQQGGGSTPNFTPVSGGKSGSAWGSRYWDGCKPSCGWKANSPGNTAHSCDRDGTTRLTDLDAKNISDGGNAGVCLDQAPRVSNNVAYAYAASHTNGDCGKCFLLEFDGTSHDGTETSGLKGKKMVIMISNIGGDVGGNQFDIMIPGGGVGIFDCISGNNPLSTVKNVEKYGGILTTCGGAKKGANLTQVKSCVKGYCEKISNADAKAGCMFMAEWYEAANNPNFSFKEVQCPSELTSRF